MSTPHDSLFRDTQAEPEHAALLLRALLPAPLVAAIPPTRAIRERHGPRLWTDRILDAASLAEVFEGDR